MATGIIGLIVFQLWQAYDTAAPTLAEARAATPDDLNIRQRMMDADLSVGTLAVLIGVTYAVMTRDVSVLILMMVIFTALSLWRRSIIAAEQR